MVKPYLKLNRAQNVTVRGYSHVLSGKECQDRSISWFNRRYSAAIVCDGHGGDKYIRSAIGSSIACEVGKKQICELFDKAPLYRFDSNTKDRYLRQLELSIIQEWNNRVACHCALFPLSQDARYLALSDADKQSLDISPSKAYGTTFIAVICCDGCCYALKLGDGNISVAYADGTVALLSDLDDESLQFNVTTSLCSSQADVDFKHCVIECSQSNPAVGVVITTDGVINCYNTTQAYLSFIGNVYRAFFEDDVDKATAELIDCLNTLTEKGSGDDLSVAVIY